MSGFLFITRMFPACCQMTSPLGPVVQSWISANPGLKLNLEFLFVYFCESVYFEMSEKKTPNDPDKISEEIFLNS